jgi:catechol 2,3-dioxygenase-like lactoylglutathione lyase family enzyme
MDIFVEHIAIPAANPVGLKKWYERVLGAREVFNNGENPPTCLISLGDVWFVFPVVIGQISRFIAK